MVKNLPANAGDRDVGSIPGWGRFLEAGNGNPLGYSCLEVIPWTKEPGGLQCMGSQLDVTEHLSTTTISFKTLSTSTVTFQDTGGCCLFLLWDKDKDGYQVCGTKTLLDIKEAVYAVACDRCPM